MENAPDTTEQIENQKKESHTLTLTPSPAHSDPALKEVGGSPLAVSGEVGASHFGPAAPKPRAFSVSSKRSPPEQPKAARSGASQNSSPKTQPKFPGIKRTRTDNRQSSEEKGPESEDNVIIRKLFRRSFSEGKGKHKREFKHVRGTNTPQPFTASVPPPRTSGSPTPRDKGPSDTPLTSSGPFPLDEDDLEGLQRALSSGSIHKDVFQHPKAKQTPSDSLPKKEITSPRSNISKTSSEKKHKNSRKEKSLTKSDSCTEQTTDKSGLLEVYQLLQQNVDKYSHLKDKKADPKSKRVFTGKDLLDYLETASYSREDAINLGKQLLSEFMIEALKGNEFKDTPNLMYRLVDNEEKTKRKRKTESKKKEFKSETPERTRPKLISVNSDKKFKSGKRLTLYFDYKLKDKKVLVFDPNKKISEALEVVCAARGLSLSDFVVKTTDGLPLDLTPTMTMSDLKTADLLLIRHDESELHDSNESEGSYERNSPVLLKSKKIEKGDIGPPPPDYKPTPPPPESYVSQKVFTIHLTADEKKSVIFEPKKKVMDILHGICLSRGLSASDCYLADLNGEALVVTDVMALEELDVKEVKLVVKAKVPKSDGLVESEKVAAESVDKSEEERYKASYSQKEYLLNSTEESKEDENLLLYKKLIELINTLKQNSLINSPQNAILPEIFKSITDNLVDLDTSNSISWSPFQIAYISDFFKCFQFLQDNLFQLPPASAVPIDTTVVKKKEMDVPVRNSRKGKTGTPKKQRSEKRKSSRRAASPSPPREAASSPTPSPVLPHTDQKVRSKKEHMIKALEPISKFLSHTPDDSSEKRKKQLNHKLTQDKDSKSADSIRPSGSNISDDAAISSISFVVNPASAETARPALGKRESQLIREDMAPFLPVIEAPEMAPSEELSNSVTIKVVSDSSHLSPTLVGSKSFNSTSSKEKRKSLEVMPESSPLNLNKTRDQTDESHSSEIVHSHYEGSEFSELSETHPLPESLSPEPQQPPPDILPPPPESNPPPIAPPVPAVEVISPTVELLPSGKLDDLQNIKKEDVLVETTEDFALTPQLERQLKEVFTIFDIHGLGYIDKGGLVEILGTVGKTFTDAEVDQLLEEVDKDKKGKIYYEEFKEMMIKQMKPRDKESEVRKFFQIFDPQNTGFIEPAELIEVFTSMGDSMSPQEVNNLIDQCLDPTNNKVDFEKLVKLLSN